jgi:hypothetical protein
MMEMKVYEIEDFERETEQEINKAKERKGFGKTRHNFNRKPIQDFRAMRKMKNFS